MIMEKSSANMYTDGQKGTSSLDGVARFNNHEHRRKNYFHTRATKTTALGGSLSDRANSIKYAVERMQPQKDDAYAYYRIDRLCVGLRGLERDGNARHP